MAKIQSSTSFMSKPKATRTGVHSKSKTSKLKTSKLYKKRYKGQGK
jgi:hypothetical protein